MQFNKLSRYKLAIIGVIFGGLSIGGLGYFLTQNSSSQSGSTDTNTSYSSSVNIDNGDEDIDWDSLPTTTVTLTDAGLEITEAGTYIISGSTTSGITINTDANVRLSLNGVTIKNTDGPAIYVEVAENTVIRLVNNSTNSIEDSSTYSDETLDGAIYSADDLVLEGEGTLNVTSNFSDAIVSKDDLKITSGTYNIVSADDGIRGKDSVTITGGTINVEAVGDGLKATNDTNADKGFVYISGGEINLAVGDDGIHAEEKIQITNGTINITSGYEGLEAATIIIDGGTIAVNVTDDGFNAVASNFTTTPSITINNGLIDIAVGSGDTDAIDSNGDVYINGGTINITAPTSSIDYDGSGELNGGTVTVNGTQITEMPTNQMMGGGGRPM